jgi:hypothetical protein
MKIRHVDAYKYLSPTAVRYTNKQGDFIVIRKGMVFYDFTMDVKGNYVSLRPKGGPYFKISNEAQLTLASRSKEHLLDAQGDPLPPSDGSIRTFDNSVEYQLLFLKYKNKIITELGNFMTKAVADNVAIETVNTISSGSLSGTLGVAGKLKGISYNLEFHLCANPYFSYSIWVPRSSGIAEDKLPAWSRRLSKRITEIQGMLFTPLKLKVNPVNKSRSIVSLPSRKFDGVIYQWSCKI